MSHTKTNVEETVAQLVDFIFSSGTGKEYTRLVLAEKGQLEGYPGWGKLPLTDKIKEAFASPLVSPQSVWEQAILIVDDYYSGNAFTFGQKYGVTSIAQALKAARDAQPSDKPEVNS